MSITLLSWLHCAFLAASRPTRLLTRYSVHLGYVGAYAFRSSLPLNGATSMPIHPGCRCPFSHSVFRRSVADAYRGLPLLYSRRVLFFFLLLFVSSVALRLYRKPIVIVLQHVITQSVFTHRPFALYLSSWRVLLSWWKVADSNRLLIRGLQGLPYD